MMEVAAVEVSRTYRSLGISSCLLRRIVDHPLREKRIFYMVGYSWSWDLDDTGLDPMAYRSMMVRLFAKEGFQTLQTNEPNVMMRPENLFMARIGSEVGEDTRLRFKRVRFNMDG
jgi:acetoin utilization protein AcuA